jgi:hypothetical protein
MVKSNKLKQQGDAKSPGGTSNAGNPSPGDSSQNSDGFLVSPGNRDINPDFVKDNSYASVLKGNPYEALDDSDRDRPRDVEDTFFELGALLKSLSDSDQLELMTAFAKHAGLALTKLEPSDTNTTTQQDDTSWAQEMFTGRETPLQEGFRPHKKNFLRRDGTPLEAATFSPSSHLPAPTGTHQPNPQHTISTTPTVPLPMATSSLTTAPPGPDVNNRWNTAPSAQPSNGTTSSVVQPTGQRFNVGAILSSGLLLRATPRPNAHANYDLDRIIVHRHQRGSTPKDTAKIRELCTEAITPKITKGNIAKLLSGSFGSEYDIAEDAARWQTSLATIWRHIIQYDFRLIALIPLTFDPKNISSIPSNVEFVNCVLDHEKLTDDHYFAWQLFIRRFAQDEELTSDAWLEDKLWKSLDDDIKTEVRSDFEELPVDHRGSISLLRIIINRMVRNNQESRRAMEEFIKNFDIQKFPGEDVTKASLRIRAIAQSLGTTKLPADIAHRVLEGFARASTPAFASLCHYQESMISSSLVKTNLRQDSLYKTLISILGDLEVKYNELLSGNRWLGSGNNVTTQSSAFLSTEDNESSDGSDIDDYNDHVAFAAYTGRQQIPFHTWVKDKICRNCNEVGHIRRDCPKLRRSIRAAKGFRRHQQHPLKHDGYAPSSGSRNTHDTRNPTSSVPPPTDVYSTKVKALISAARDLASSAVHVTTPSADNANPTVDRDSDNNNDYSGFLAALGCPKE